MSDQTDPQQEPYRVELDTEGCKHCGSGDSYRVVGPDDVAWGTSWDDREIAEEFADAMNFAYERGTLAAASPSAPQGTIPGEELTELAALVKAHAARAERETLRAAMSEADHSSCHDLVCNASRQHPRGSKGVGCSCSSRQERDSQTIVAMRDALTWIDQAIGASR